MIYCEQVFHARTDSATYSPWAVAAAESHSVHDTQDL